MTLRTSPRLADDTRLRSERTGICTLAPPIVRGPDTGNGRIFINLVDDFRHQPDERSRPTWLSTPSSTSVFTTRWNSWMSKTAQPQCARMAGRTCGGRPAPSRLLSCATGGRSIDATRDSAISSVIPLCPLAIGRRPTAPPRCSDGLEGAQPWEAVSRACQGIFSLARLPKHELVPPGSTSAASNRQQPSS